jgi:hypothetical protein
MEVDMKKRRIDKSSRADVIMLILFFISQAVILAGVYVERKDITAFGLGITLTVMLIQLYNITKGE